MSDLALIGAITALLLLAMLTLRHGGSAGDHEELPRRVPVPIPGDRRAVERAFAEVGSLRRYLEDRLTRLPAVATSDLREALAEAERVVQDARTLFASGQAATALTRIRGVRGDMLAIRKTLTLRLAAAARLDALPARLASLEADLGRLKNAGFRGLPALPVASLASRAKEARRRLETGDPLALTIELSLQDEVRELESALTRFDVLQRENERAIARLRHDVEELALRAAQPRPHIQEHFDRHDRAAAERARARAESRVRAMRLGLTAAAADNHLDTQRFQEAARRVALLRRELALAREELATAETRWQQLETEERQLHARLDRLDADVAALQADDPDVKQLQKLAHARLERTPVALGEATRVLEALADSLKRYTEPRVSFWRESRRVISPRDKD
jgi:chromosome segregation ATPase